MSPTAALEIDHLSVQFERGEGEISAVRRASFAIPAGESFGLFGPSGCGKSTILRVIAGIQLDWSGRVTACGRD